MLGIIIKKWVILEFIVDILRLGHSLIVREVEFRIFSRWI